MNDRFEIDLEVVAIVSDRGFRHHRNEDAGDIAVDGDGTRIAIVVCDGVSSTANPDQASAAAVGAAMSVLADHMEAGGDSDPGEALCRAVTAARQSVKDVPTQEPGAYPGAPSTTIVVALVGPGTVALASVGDSRGYFLAEGGANRRLTVDDSWAEAAIAAGVPEDAAYGAPQSHVITNWLGGEAPDHDPVVVTADVDETGLLVVCSDGLWNYLPDPDALAAAVAAGPPSAAGDVDRPLTVARHLVQVALDAGGSDNITVAVATVGTRA